MQMQLQDKLLAAASSRMAGPTSLPSYVTSVWNFRCCHQQWSASLSMFWKLDLSHQPPELTSSLPFSFVLLHSPTMSLLVCLVHKGDYLVFFVFFPSFYFIFLPLFCFLLGKTVIIKHLQLLKLD